MDSAQALGQTPSVFNHQVWICLFFLPQVWGRVRVCGGGEYEGETARLRGQSHRLQASPTRSKGMCLVLKLVGSCTLLNCVAPVNASFYMKPTAKPYSVDAA